MGYQIGHPVSKETCKKISEAKMGHPVTEETRKKISKAKKGVSNKNVGNFKKGVIPWNKGLPMREESKVKLSKSLRGHTPYNKGTHQIEPLYDIYYCTVCGKRLTERQVSCLLCRPRLNGKHPDAWFCSNKHANQYIGINHRGKNHHMYGKKMAADHLKKLIQASTGRIPWNKGTRGIMKPNRTSFKKGQNMGKNHPNWQGGLSYEPYGKGWKQIKPEIRDRDNHQCQLCGKKETTRAFDVHHIDYDKKNLDPNNLITLCNSCHMKTGFHREQWISVFRSLFLFKIMILLEDKGKVRAYKKL